MEQLIKVRLNQKQQQVVSARELYEFLGLNLTQWKRWCKRNIELNQFHSKDQDWETLDHRSSSINYQDYAITIDFAKHLSMMAKTSKANQARNYFIQCERQLKELSTPQIPQTYAAALLEAGRLALELETTQAKLLEAQPKVEFYDAVTESTDCIDLGTAAKVLNIGFGRTTMFEKLRELKVLMPNNQPYQTEIDKGYFRVIETKWSKPNGDTHVYFKTMVFQKGLDYIRKLLTKQ